MRIELTPEQAQFVEQLLTTGDYANEGEVVAQALARWQQEAVMEIRASVQRGLDDLDAGRYRTISTPEEAQAFAAEIKQRVRELAAKREQNSRQNSR